MNRRTAPPRQHGIALLVMLTILGMVGLFFVLGSLSRLSFQNERNSATSAVLAQAKEALIGYALTYSDSNPFNVLGYLPCPDLGRGLEGLEDSAGCIGASNQDLSVVGRLPWRTLGLPPLHDGNGDCLWYAVSGNFKSKTKTNLMSWDSLGQFEVIAPDGSSKEAGSLPSNRAVAIIFSPGKAIGAQNRGLDATLTVPECGGNMDAANYLDTATVGASTFSNSFANSWGTALHIVDSTANQIKQFIRGDVKDSSGNEVINDHLLFITPDDIFLNHIEKRPDFSLNLVDPTTGMLRKVAECLANYGLVVSGPADMRLPWAAPLSIRNYGNKALYVSTASNLAGRAPYKINTTNWLIKTNANCPNFDTTADVWWNNWKDQVFYAVADAYKPTAVTLPASCSTPSACLTVDGIGPYAAVVIFAGKKLAAQSRTTNVDYTSTDKANLANYLEGNNLTAMAAPGNGNFTQGSFTSSSNNDILMCIKQDLTTVTPCP
ncbi:MAG: hypothetical protein K8F27_04835 [Sulfuricellaceae bacterium]|nr:hypothetical protein [Sulfuricellaceae bacterium]